MTSGSARLEDWSAKQHHADRTAISFSGLKLLGEVTDDGGSLDPASFRAYLDGTLAVSESKALNFGIATHMALYEPDRLLQSLAVRPLNDDGKLLNANTNAYKDWKAEQLAAGRVIITPAEELAIKHMLAALGRSPSFRQLRRLRPFFREQSITWTDPETGLRLKIRTDTVRERPSDGAWVIEDLKTCSDARPDAFTRDCIRYRYFDRSAFYQDGIEALTGKRPRVVLVPVQKDDPYQVAVYEPAPHRLEEGRARNRALLHEAARCIEQDQWLARWQLEPIVIGNR